MAGSFILTWESGKGKEIERTRRKTEERAPKVDELGENDSIALLFSFFPICFFLRVLYVWFFFRVYCFFFFLLLWDTCI
jgi:hypothetical protein